MSLPARKVRGYIKYPPARQYNPWDGPQLGPTSVLRGRDQELFDHLVRTKKVLEMEYEPAWPAFIIPSYATGIHWPIRLPPDWVQLVSDSLYDGWEIQFDRRGVHEVAHKFEVDI